jgi:hypothetical protein
MIINPSFFSSLPEGIDEGSPENEEDTEAVQQGEEATFSAELTNKIR